MGVSRPRAVEDEEMNLETSRIDDEWEDDQGGDPSHPVLDVRALDRNVSKRVESADYAL